MKEIKYIKINTLLLLAILPLSIVGYLFAVYNESMFYLFEWALLLLIFGVIIISIFNIIKIKTKLKWISVSILAFMIQFSVLSLFLGPFTKYALIFVYYIVAFLAFVMFVVTIKKVKKFKFIPVIFMIFSIIFTLYMFLLNNLWGKDLS